MVGRGCECVRIAVAPLKEYIAIGPSLSPERRQCPTNCSLSRSSKAQLGLFLARSERQRFEMKGRSIACIRTARIGEAPKAYLLTSAPSRREVIVFVCSRRCRIGALTNVFGGARLLVSSRLGWRGGKELFN